MKKSHVILAGAVAAAVLFTTSCGGGNAKSNAPASSSGSSSGGAVTYREHFVAGIDTMPTVFNPGSNAAPVLNDMVYDELIHYNKVKAELEPCLATSWNWVGDDCKVLHLELRNDVVFHNGNKFTAADVDYSLANCANTNIGSYYDHADIKNDYSMDIYLKSANADFIYVLTNTLYAGILDKESCEADKDNGTAIGSGPWMIDLANTIPGDTIELVRNEKYWGEMPKSKKITLRYISADSSRLIALQNKEIQAMMTVGDTDINTVKNDPNLEYCTGTGVGPAKLYYIGFNMKNGVCANNVYLRQAVACIMNRADIIAASGDEDAEASDGIFWGFDTPYRASLSQCAEDLSMNKEKALQLVEKAKEVAGGTIPVIHLLGNTKKSINMSMCLLVQQQCKEIGIPVEIDESDSAGVLARTKYGNPQFDMIQYNVPLESWASASNRMFVQNSNNNRSNLDSDYVTDLLTKAAATSDESLRTKYYNDVQIYIHDNAVYIPAYYGSRNGAQLKGVEGIVWPNDGYPEFAYAAMPQ